MGYVRIDVKRNDWQPRFHPYAWEASKRLSAHAFVVRYGRTRRQAVKNLRKALRVV